MSLKIMTYNIRHGAGMDDVVDLDRQANVILDATPDVVGLQEVDSCVKRSGYIPEAAILGMCKAANPKINNIGWSYGLLAVLPFNAMKDVMVIILTLLTYKSVHKFIDSKLQN